MELAPRITAYESARRLSAVIAMNLADVLATPYAQSLAVSFTNQRWFARSYVERVGGLRERQKPYLPGRFLLYNRRSYASDHSPRRRQPFGPP